jgi:hypothetical protein
MLSPPSIGGPVRDALLAKIGHLSKLVGWATVTVAAGVALEGVELVHDVVKWTKKRRVRTKELADLKELAEIFPASGIAARTKSMSSDHPRWVKVLTRVGLIAVVIGVVAEWRCGAKLEEAHNDLQTFDESLIADTQKEAEQLRKDAEAERLARVTIEARVAFRHLTAWQQQEIAASLKPLCSGQMVSPSSPLGDTESAMFAIDIANALQATKALQVNAPGVRMVGLNGASSGQSYPPLSTGVIVRVFANSSQLGPAFSSNPQLGKAIAKELTKRGFDALELDDKTLGTGAILIEVNPHPEGPQGEYKLQAQRDAEAQKKQIQTSQTDK